MGYDTLIVERRGNVGWLIFDRPEAMNAFDVQMVAELADAWAELDDDDAVHVIVNTGRGRAFQTGADVKEVATTGGVERRSDTTPVPGARPRGMTSRANGVWKPVICAINGYCVGGGFHFVGDADFVVASSAATFLDSHTSVGMVAALEPLGLLGRMPFGSIMRMVLMGRHERFDAQRAYELGLVTQVIEAERFEEEVQALAEVVASNSPSTMISSKYALWQGLEHAREAARVLGERISADLLDHPDAREGPRAFAERRPPVWGPPRRPRVHPEGA